jgi:hypothetical protein
MTYKRVGTIKNASEIPFDKNLIVTGILGSGWMWRMEGVFKHKENKVVFEDIHGCVSKVKGNINLTILEKTTA